MFKGYTMNQGILPLELERKLQENDIVHCLVEEIPDEAFAGFFRKTGCPFCSSYTKAKEGNNRKIYFNKKREE